MKSVAFLSVLLFSHTILQAQKLQALPGEKDWVIHSVYPANKSWFSDFNNAFNKSIIYIGNDEAIFSIRYEKGGGLAKLDNAGKIVWTLNLPYTVCAIGKLEKEIVAFQISETGVIATLVDPTTGQKSKEQPVYSFGAKEGPHVSALNAQSGDFKCFVIRTDATSGERFPDAEDRNAVSKFTIVYLDEAKNFVSKEIKLFGKDNAFIGSTVNDEGEIYVSTQSGDQIIVEQFSAKGEPITKLITSFLLKKKGSYVPVLVADQQNKKGVILGMYYENKDKSSYNTFYNFDFTAKKAFTIAEEKLNKDFGRSLGAVKEHKGPAGRLGSIDGLQIVDILQTRDKNIVIREMRSIGVDTRAMDYFHEYLIVSFYDHSWKLLGNVAYDKMLQTSAGLGRSLGYWIEGEKLYFTLNVLSSLLADYSTLLLTLDIDAMKLEKTSTLEKSGMPAKAYLEGGGTIHFGNTIYLQNIVPQKAYYNTQFVHTVLQRLDL